MPAAEEAFPSLGRQMQVDPSLKKKKETAARAKKVVHKGPVPITEAQLPEPAAARSRSKRKQTLAEFEEELSRAKPESGPAWGGAATASPQSAKGSGGGEADARRDAGAAPGLGTFSLKDIEQEAALEMSAARKRAAARAFAGRAAAAARGGGGGASASSPPHWASSSPPPATSGGGGGGGGWSMAGSPVASPVAAAAVAQNFPSLGSSPARVDLRAVFLAEEQSERHRQREVCGGGWWWGGSG